MLGRDKKYIVFACSLLILFGCNQNVSNSEKNNSNEPEVLSQLIKYGYTIDDFIWLNNYILANKYFIVRPTVFLEFDSSGNMILLNDKQRYFWEIDYQNAIVKSYSFVSNKNETYRSFIVRSYSDKYVSEMIVIDLLYDRIDINKYNINLIDFTYGVRYEEKMIGGYSLILNKGMKK